MDYNARVHRRVGEYDATRLSFGLVFVLYNSPKGPEHPDAGRCSLLHYPRYPWEQRGSYGNYTVVNELKCWIMHSPDTSGEGTVHQAEKKVRHKNCSTASPSSQGKLFCTQLRDACVC